jgi:acetyl-CoA acetyltransferase/uncharacterized OB-fold protein
MSREHPAIIGMGLGPISIRAEGAPENLATQAVTAALADAGLTRRDVDGLLVNSSQGIRPDRVGTALARHGGFSDLRLLEHIEIKGATALAMVTRAVLAIRAGMASTVVCVFADAPLKAGKGSGSTYAQSGGNDGTRGLERASGLLGSVPTYALLANRYLHVTGNSALDLCAVAVSARQWAVDNPDAVVRKPLDAEAYFASTVVSDPLRVLDCARPVNGSAAVIVSDRPAAGGVGLRVTGMGFEHPMRRRRAPGESWFGGGARAASDALTMAGVERSDLDLLELYDPFSVVTLCLLEEYGFCEPGVRAFRCHRARGLAAGQHRRRPALGLLPAGHDPAGGGRGAAARRRWPAPGARRRARARRRHRRPDRPPRVHGAGKGGRGVTTLNELPTGAPTDATTEPDDVATDALAADADSTPDWLVADSLTPGTTGEMAPLFAAAARGALAMPFCGACGTALELEQQVCDACGADVVLWRDVELAGVVHSSTLVHRREPGLILTDRPYPVLDVELTSGHRLLMTTTLPTDVAPAIGRPVGIGFRTVGGVAVPSADLPT